MSKKDGLSEADRALFREAVKNTKPLDCANTRIKSEPPTRSSSVPVNKKHRTAEINVPSTPHHLSSYIREQVQSETILSFYRSGLNKKDMLRLKKGEYPIDAVLDLHGRIPDDAQDILCAFITAQYQQQRRLVLIIHGKGGRLGEAPVIKNLVHCWLPQLPHVLAFHSAAAKHGGAGALYVLLRKYI